MSTVTVHMISPHPRLSKRSRSKTPSKTKISLISSHGERVIPPVTVRTIGERWELLDGYDWWVAAGAAGLDRIPANVVDLSDDECLSWFSDDDLWSDPISQAVSLQDLMKREKLSVTQASLQIGMNRSTAAHLLRLLSLEPSVQELVRVGKLPVGKAKALARLPLQVQRHVVQRVCSPSWSVRAVESLAQRLLSDQDLDPGWQKQIERVERIVSEKTGIPVSVDWLPGEKGSLTFHFENTEILEGLLNHLNIKDL